MIELQKSTWGIRLNEKHYSKFDIEAPNWARNNPGLSWYSEGIIIWDEAKKTIVNLDFWYAISLLDHLRKNQKWKDTGQNVSEEKIEFSFELKRRKRGKTATPDEERPAETKKVITKLHLSPQRTQKLLDFLEQNEQIIRVRGTIIKDQYYRGIKLLVDFLHEEKSMQRNQEGLQD
jgi:hypothetical protein